MKVFIAQNLKKKYGSQKVLDNISLSIEEADIYGIVGPNGAGKTTLIKIICGLTRPSGGKYFLFDTDKDLANSRSKIGMIIEQPALIGSYTCYQNLYFIATLLGLKNKHAKIEEILNLVELIDSKNKKAKHLSLGMKQRLAIAISLIKNPKFLVLDEPINGLDPLAIIDIRKLLIKLNKEQGITILISSHILSELENLVNKVAFMDRGKLIAVKLISEIEESSSLESYYVKVMRGNLE